MSERAFEADASKARPAQLALIVPLALERQCLADTEVNHHGTIVTISQCGQGARNAARAARAAIEQGATALMSIGVAGGLAKGPDAGDAVVPDTVVNAEDGRAVACSQSWVAALRNHIDALGGAHSGSLLSVPDVLGKSSEKTAAGNRFRCVACDMESSAIGMVAQEAGVYFAVLRVISDTYSDELPNNVSRWVDNSGNARVAPVLGAIMSPARWRSVISMTTRFRFAQRRLRELSGALGAAAYCCPKQ